MKGILRLRASGEAANPTVRHCSSERLFSEVQRFPERPFLHAERRGASNSGQSHPLACTQETVRIAESIGTKIRQQFTENQEPPVETPDPQYLAPTAIIDSDHPEVVRFADQICGGETDPVEQAVRLYYAVRDGVRYDPYYPFYLPEHYRASNVLRSRRSFCIPKVSLLCAVARARGIPARAGFATVRNHLATRQLLEFLGSDLFVFHGFAELFLEGQWVKATPAFNRELCDRHHVTPLAFDGRSDSVFQPYSLENKRFMEYLVSHGTYADIPVAEIVAAWEDTYGRNRVRGWIADFETAARQHDFEQEEVISP
jgi:transglutaminase-like putative cysteine protease